MLQIKELSTARRIRDLGSKSPSSALILILLQGCVTQPSVREERRAGCEEKSQLRAAMGDRITVASDRDVLQAGGVDPEAIQCNNRVVWETRIERYAQKISEGIADLGKAPPDPAQQKKVRQLALGYLVRSFFETANPQNLGVMVLKDRFTLDEKGQKRPLLVFRSGLIFGDRGVSPCFKSLVDKGRVRHVFNLYTGSFPFGDVIQAEKAHAGRLGVTYLDAAETTAGDFRQLVEEEKDYDKNARVVMERLAGLVQRILRPEGRAPRGNLYLHCGGGMHRSGMVFGVMRRCINGDSMERIEEEFKRHTGWTSDQRPGGFEPLNLRVVRDFDCGLLR